MIWWAKNVCCPTCNQSDRYVYVYDEMYGVLMEWLGNLSFARDTYMKELGHSNDTVMLEQFWAIREKLAEPIWPENAQQPKTEEK